MVELEVEYKVQSGIAEAALGVANDNTASKAVRRKHRLMYQQSRRRLAELEAKLDLLRQSSKPQQTKQRKKPRPPLDDGNKLIIFVHSETYQNDHLHSVVTSINSYFFLELLIFP